MQHWCRRTAAALGVPLQLVGVQGRPAPGDSIEAWARDARYAALADVVTGGDVLLLAHHAADQAEGFLLAALRGSGPAGLASAAAQRPLGDGVLLRPWLEVPERDIDHYVQAHGLDWFEDPMNADTRLDRVWLREAVLPQFTQRRAGALGALARAARHAGEATRLCDELAEIDLQTVAIGNGCLSVDALRRLRPGRAANALRRHVAMQGWPVPDTHTVRRILDEVCTAAPDAQPLVRWGHCEARRHRGVLYFSECWPAHEPLQWQQEWTGGAMPLPAGLGRLHADAGGRWQVRWPKASDRIAQPGRPRKAWRRWCQEQGLPPWMRMRVPLVLAGDTICAAGARVIRPRQAPAGLRWLDAPPAAAVLAQAS